MVRNLAMKLKCNPLFKDSFWAVFGNGLGYGFLLLAGIIIARFLGKDVYGEYGIVKTTMFYIASFAAFGLGFTSTKYVAEYVQKNKAHIKSISNDALLLTFLSSFLMSVLLQLFAEPLADFINEPGLTVIFRLLGWVVVFRALSTTQSGILAGIGAFKVIARNSVLAGLFMLLVCIPLTYFWGLMGSLSSLLMSQMFGVGINYLSLKKVYFNLPVQEKVSYKKKLLSFSFPIALQESSYMICNWGGILLLTKLSSLGELGIFSATAQWNAIITFIPSLLYNVVLSHLSSSIGNHDVHKKTFSLMLGIYLICTLIPFSLVYILSDWIVSFYGDSFIGMAPVMRILVLSTIFTCCSDLFRAEYTSKGRNWLLFGVRLFRDIMLLSISYYLISSYNGENAAMHYAEASVLSGILYFLSLLVLYLLGKRNHGSLKSESCKSQK